MKVLVTGAFGQVGQALQSIADKYPEFTFNFASSSDVDITDVDSVAKIFNSFAPDYCINAAAYTAVDKAESEPEKARLLNVDGARNLAIACAKSDTTLVHISTDFVFDGENENPYTERDIPNPQSIYGQTKLAGELEIQENLTKYFIIRTSWVYSEFGTNFMKTMLRLASERDSLSVVDDQIGSPTNAVDLADAVLQIIQFSAQNPEPFTQNLEPSTLNPEPCALNLTSSTLSLYGTYNFSNEGQCSWYEFAKKIFEIYKIEINLHAIPTSAFPTAAKRPKFSVLDKGKIEDLFGFEINSWAKSLTNTNLVR